jgi:hypothetical protein
MVVFVKTNVDACVRLFCQFLECFQLAQPQ